MRSARLVAALALLLTVPQTASAAADWRGFRGPSYDGSGSLGRPWPEWPAAAMDWRQPLGSGYAGVVVAGDRAYTAWSEGGEDWIGAFAAGSGARVWRRSLGPTYAGHDGSHDGPIATPTLVGNRVVVLTPRGRLAAFAVADGSPAWQVELNAESGSEPPHYGVSSSPLAVDLDGTGALVVVEHRVTGSHAVSAYDVATGERRWKAGDDAINYQSPVLATLAGRRQVLAAGDKLLVGLDPGTGKLLWSYEHGGDAGDQGAGKIVPLPLGGDRVFLAHALAESQVVKIVERDGGLAVEKVWSSPAIGRSYAPPVHFDGLLIGYAGTILVGVDAATGERKWRSREPGDGFLLRIDERLAVLTKKGTLHLGRADASGWVEEASLQLFEGYSWSPPSIAAGAIYARSHSQVARVSLVEATATAASAAPQSPAQGFEAFLASLAATADKQAALDAYFAKLPPGPVIEGERVHFVYRGPGEDLAIMGDMVGSRIQEPMHRVEGTDLFVYSATLPTDALVSYRFVRDFENVIPDPRGVLQVEERPGAPASWLAMPAARQADFLGEPPAERRGRLVTHELDDAKFEKKRRIDVWLPPGYDAASDRYPVVYLHTGPPVIDLGLLPTALDNLVGGGRLRPLIAVVIHRVDERSFAEFTARRDDYIGSVAEGVVPFVDRTYRTVAERGSRISYGARFPGAVALSAALKRPETFGVVATQSAFMLDSERRGLLEAVPDVKAHPLTVHLEWGRFDERAPHEGWDIGRENARLADGLRERGLTVNSREVAAGSGWCSWRTRWDLVLGGLFP